jgi:hypothetical protein
VYDPSGQSWQGTPVSGGGDSGGTGSGTGSGSGSGSGVTMVGIIAHIDTPHFVPVEGVITFEAVMTEGPIVKSHEAVDLVMAEEASQE